MTSNAENENLADFHGGLQKIKKRFPVVKYFLPIPEPDGEMIFMVASGPRPVGKKKYKLEKYPNAIGNIKTLRGKSLDWIKKQKPKGWKTLPKDNGLGWKWVDETGRERLIFQRPSGLNASKSQWSRMENGYFRWLDENGNFLDIDGKMIPKTDLDFPVKTHIPYEGIVE